MKVWIAQDNFIRELGEEVSKQVAIEMNLCLKNGHNSKSRESYYRQRELYSTSQYPFVPQ